MRLCRSVLVGFLLVPAGCGGSKLYPVEGQVIFKDGTPLTGGSVIFESKEPNSTTAARGDIRPDGTFRLGTFKEHDGVEAGSYRVLVMPPATNRKHPGPPILHARYQKLATTTLECAVPQDENTYILTVDKP